MSSSGPTGHRPGGLTALAVLNFIFGGLGALGLLVLFALLKAADEVSGGQLNKAIPNRGLVYLSLLLSVVAVCLLIASGVGYLGQKRLLGKIFGNTYGLLGLASTAVSAATRGDFGISDIIGLIYPVLTLALLNTVFKDDFPNP